MKNDHATKADLNELKDELKNDMNELRNELKSEMKDMREDIGVQLINLNNKVEQNSLELKNEMNEKFDTVIITLDGLAGLISNGRVEKAAAESTFRRHETKLEDHESRIGNLERNAG
jgi:hypothetical protein